MNYLQSFKLFESKESEIIEDCVSELLDDFNYTLNIVTPEEQLMRLGSVGDAENLSYVITRSLDSEFLQSEVLSALRHLASITNYQQYEQFRKTSLKNKTIFDTLNRITSISIFIDSCDSLRRGRDEEKAKQIANSLSQRIEYLCNYKEFRSRTLIHNEWGVILMMYFIRL